MINYYDKNGIIDSEKVVETIKEVNDKLKTETNKSKRTQLMFEQMLRGLYINPLY